MALIWSQLAFHTLKGQSLPFQGKRSWELVQAGQRKIIAFAQMCSSRAKIFSCWSLLRGAIGSAIRGQIHTRASEERTLLPGRTGRDLGKSKKTLMMPHHFSCGSYLTFGSYFPPSAATSVFQAITRIRAVIVSITSFIKKNAWLFHKALL